ncbi:MAG TPA: hypothetical protein VGF79_09290 [Bacteroidia bacterium]
MKYADSVYNRLEVEDFNKNSIKSYRIIEHRVGLLGRIKSDSIIRTETRLSADRQLLRSYINQSELLDTIHYNAHHKKMYHGRLEFRESEKHRCDTYYSRVYCHYDTIQNLTSASYTLFKMANGHEYSLMDSFERLWFRNERGKTDRSEDHYANRFHVSSICTYNAMGMISSIEYFDGNKNHYNFESVKRYFYNTDSALIEMTDSNSERLIRILYTYKGKHLMMTNRTIVENPRCFIVQVPLRKFEYRTDYDSMGQVKFVYNSARKKVINIENHYEHNRLTWRIIKIKNKRIKEEYVYNEKGSLIAVRVYRRGIKKSEIDYVYDSMGRLSKLKRYKNGVLRECISIVFDKL